jgi:hypothetical protein
VKARGRWRHLQDAKARMNAKGSPRFRSARIRAT